MTLFDLLCVPSPYLANIPLSSISARMSIRESISSGDMDRALSQIDSIAPSMLKDNPALHFALKQQKLIELIRAGEVEGALHYARAELRDDCCHEVDFFPAMESIMSLLAFSSLPVEQNPMRHLFDHSRRLELGREVNQKVLEAQFASKESQLEQLMKQLQYGQTQLKTFVSSFPTMELRPSSEVDPSKNVQIKSDRKNSSAIQPPAVHILDPFVGFESLAAIDDERIRLSIASAEAARLSASNRPSHISSTGDRHRSSTHRSGSARRRSISHRMIHEDEDEPSEEEDEPDPNQYDDEEEEEEEEEEDHEDIDDESEEEDDPMA